MSSLHRKLAAASDAMADTTADTAATFAQDGLSASVQVLPLPAGLFLFAVRDATARAPQQADKLSLPAVHVGVGPGVRAGQVEFMHGPATQSGWLFAANDLLVARVKSGGATLILSSLRAPGGDVLSIKVERLDARTDAEPNAGGESNHSAGSHAAAGIAATSSTAVDARPSLKLQVAAHIRTRGDMSFADGGWAGRVGQGLWIESFAVRPLERFSEQDLEYKGLTASGFETPWVTDARMCGTKGMSTPLVGFAVRLRPGAEAAAYDCEYSGYFRSGAVVGPLRNGAPCRSTNANDPLEGIQLRIVRRVSAIGTDEGAVQIIKPFVVSPASEVSDARTRSGESRAVPRSKNTVSGRPRLKPLRALRRK